MPVELIIPPLGESIAEGTVAKWLKKVGDYVATDEPLAELETDKVTVTLPAPSAGILTEQRVEVGATVKVGASIGSIEPAAKPAGESGTRPTVAKPDSKDVKPAEAKPADAKAEPKAADSKSDAKAADSKSDAKPAEAKSEAKPADSKPVDNKADVKQAESAPAAGHAAEGGSPTVKPALTPNNRKILREQGIEPTASALSSLAPAASAPAAKASVSTSAASVPVAGPNEEVVAMSPLRKRIAERLVEAQHSAAILTTFNEVDMSYIMALRTKFQDEFVKKHGIKLGFMSFFVAACARAAQEFPGLNAEVRGDAIVYKKHYDFGIAVGGGKGLVVPVLRGVDKLSLAQIEKGIADLAAKAKDNKLQLSDLAGGTFSISNGGIYGSMMSTPLLNMPQTGILGMHNIIRRPIAVGDSIEIRPMMYLALSYDHRVVDGREAVSFLIKVKERLEQPEKLLLGI